MTKPNIIRYVGIAIAIVFGVLLIPLRYPVDYVDEQREDGVPIRLKQGESVNQVIVPTADHWSGFVVWVDPLLDENLAAVIDLRITSEGNSKDDRHVTTKVYKIFNAEERTLRFTFPSIAHSKGRRYQVVIEPTSALADGAIAVRPPIADRIMGGEVKTGYQLLATQPSWQILRHELYRAPSEGEDIYQYWRRGGQIINGENPYSCVLDNDCINHKIPIHLPLFYWLSAASIKLGLTSFESWIALWRPALLLSYIAIGLVLFVTLVKRNRFWLAIFALLFWLFNRWSLYVIRVGHLDFMALLFLVLSVVLAQKRWRTSLILLGASLAIKQVAVFVVPFYMLMAWERNKAHRWREVAVALFLIGIIPFVVSVPFLIQQPKAMIQSVLFSATRDSEANFGAPALAAILHTAGRWYMASLMLLVIIASWRHRLSLAVSSLLIFVTFIAFNTVIFNQYFVWMMPFVPLAASDYLFNRKKAIAKAQ